MTISESIFVLRTQVCIGRVAEGMAVCVVHDGGNAMVQMLLKLDLPRVVVREAIRSQPAN